MPTRGALFVPTAWGFGAENACFWYPCAMRQWRNAFFDRTDWLAFWGSAGVAFAVYVLSLGPSVGLEDAGELATAADALGVPHPPGYPLWTMLSWVFCRLFGWVTWQGFANPAWAVALCSAVTGALAAGVTAMLIARSGRDLLREATGVSEARARQMGWLSGVAGSLAFAFSPVMWSQAVIVEVYALGALFLALTMLLIYRWLRRPQGKILVWLGLVFGLGLTNYQVLLLAAVPMALLVFWRRRRLALSFLALAVPLGLTAYALMLGALPSADAFSTPGAPVILRPARAVVELTPLAIAPWWVYVAVGGELALLAGLALFRRSARFVWPVVGVLAVTVLLSGAWFAPDAPPSGFPGTLYDFRAAWLVHLVALGGLWAICWRFRRSRRFALVVTAGQLAVLCLLRQGLMLGLTDPNLWWFWWPIVWNLVVLALAWRLLPRGRQVALTALAAELGVSVYAYMPVASEGNPPMNWGYARTWEGFKNAISRGQYEAIAPSSFFSGRYLSQIMDYLADLRMQFSLPVVLLAVAGTGALVWRAVRRRLWQGLMWLGCTLLFFGVMSALLVALANPTGDLQDGFIQKVKFISSHGVFALWIGYGLAVLLTLCRRVPWPRAGWALGLVATVVVSLAPVAQNFLDRELVRAMGAAEQTGHDFGWQFGAYMLGGAPTLRAELSPEEEPLPDPFWPPPMERDAVFFGGTDPGRFVPTYMVFAAGFRPDVLVFTQNALADPTYTNVQRDLYGDRLWVPSADNVHDAFTDYVDAVQAGRRKTKGTIVEVNGRMQITGAAAVMDINADLSRLLFERNPDRAFYLEESYPVPWMDGVLEPAGLAMRLSRGGRDLEELAPRDDDFWDWMTRRLAMRWAYRRDFAAQKSFSKLRSAMAGVYARNNLREAAEAAYLEAVLLYPFSPEAVFRYVQEVLMRAFRFDDALWVLRAYRQADPGNAKAGLLEEHLRSLQRAHKVFVRLTEKVRAKAATTAEVCELARVCEELGLRKGAADYWKQVVTASDLTAQDARDGCLALQRLRLAEPALALLRRVPEAVWPTFSETELVAASGLAQSGGDATLALGLLEVALRKAPKSGRVWLGIALYYYGVGDEARAYDGMRNAVANGARSLIEGDPAVAEIFLRLMRRYGQRKGAER